MTSNADEIEGPKRISEAVSRIFYPATTESILPWFGFFDSSFHLTVYLISMAVLLIGVTVSLLNFDIYQEFDSESKSFVVYSVITPTLFLSLSNMASQLAFVRSGNLIEDKVLRFLMVYDVNGVVERNAVQMREFRREFSSQLLKLRVIVGGFGLSLVFFKIASCWVLKLMFDASTDRRGDFLLGTTDFVGFLIVEIPFFWSIDRVLNDISSDNEIIRAAIVERREQLRLVSSNTALISKWARVANYGTRNRIGFQLFVPGSRGAQMTLFVGLLPIGIVTIATIGKLTAYLP